MKSKLLYKYEIVVDGKKVGILFDSKKTRKEVKRLKNLRGVKIVMSEVLQ